MRDDPKTSISYFGFPAVVKPGAPFTRNELTEYLEKNNIGTRNVFSGNLLRHPAYLYLNKTFHVPRSTFNFVNADLIMNNAFWIGVWPGIGKKEIKYIKNSVEKFLKLT